MKTQISNLKTEIAEERKRLEEKQATMQRNFDSKMNDLQYEMDMKDQEHAEKIEEMRKIIEKKNYESYYPIPETLEKHFKKNENSFNIQILGCRGAGKSTFVNKFMRRAGFGKVAATGTHETTKTTAFYDITSKIEQIPNKYRTVFICDQPGIGGLEITEAKYLSQFGPGKYIQLLTYYPIFPLTYIGNISGSSLSVGTRIRKCFFGHL